jgi:hypothetical protein
MLAITERKYNRIPIEDEPQEDYILEHKRITPTDNSTITPGINKHSIALRMLHNLSHR